MPSIEHAIEDIPIVRAIDTIGNHPKGKGIQDIVIQSPRLIKIWPMEKIWPRRQVFKGSNFSFRPLQAENSSAGETNGLFFFRLLYENSTKVGLEDVIYGRK